MELFHLGSFYVGILDVVLILALVIFMILGWKNGFLVKIVEMASGLFGVLASVLLARSFSTVLNQWVGTAITEKVHEYLLATPLFEAAVNETSVRTALSSMSLPTFLVDWIVRGIDFGGLQTSIIGAVEPVIVNMILLVLSFVVLFFGSMVVFFILKLLAKAITSIPVIKEIDKVLGVLFGIIKIGAIVLILFMILGLVMTVPSINTAIRPFLETDMGLGDETHFHIAKWIYDNNPIQKVLDLFLTVVPTV